MVRTEKLLGYADIAELVGVSVATVREYNTRAKRHRKLAAETGSKDHMKPSDLPEPDKMFGQSPVWKESTITKWMTKRLPPGRPRTSREPQTTSK